MTEKLKDQFHEKLDQSGHTDTPAFGSQASEKPPVLPRRWPAALLLAGLAAAFLLEIGLRRGPWLDNWFFLFERIRVVVLVGFLPLTGLLLGYMVLKPLRARWGLGGEPALVLCLALGWGLLSHFVWLLAALGTLFSWNLFHKITPLVCIVVVVFLGRSRVYELIRQIVLRYRLGVETAVFQMGGINRFFWPLALLAGGLTLSRLFLTAMSPSFLYDVMEYHLPAAWRYLETGGFSPILGNRYTQMPQAVEALFAFACLLEGAPGGLAPKLVHLYLALSTALVLNALLRKFRVTPVLRLMGVGLFLLHPISFKLTADAYVGMATAMFSAAALVCWLRARRLSNRLDLMLGAAFMGLSVACKYPAAGIAALPFVLILIPLTPVESLPYIPWRVPRLIHYALAACSVAFLMLLAYSPWMLRSLWMTGAFFPPLTDPALYTFALRDNTGLREMMQWYHRMITPFDVAFWKNIGPGLLQGVGPLFLVPLPALLFWKNIGTREKGLAAFTLLGLVVWCLTPHPEDRFLAPLLPMLAALPVLLAQRLRLYRPGIAWTWQVLLGAWLAAFFFSQMLEGHRMHFFRTGFGIQSRQAFLEARLGRTAPFFEAIQKAVEKNPQNAKVLLVYEARPALLGPGITVACNTVFDALPIVRYNDYVLNDIGESQETRAMLDALRLHGITHVAVNEVELARLVATYPALPAWEDPAYRKVREQSPGGSFDPAFLQFGHYYGPFFYKWSGNINQASRKNAHAYYRDVRDMLAYLRQHSPPLWEENLGGARMWVCRMPE